MVVWKIGHLQMGFSATGSAGSSDVAILEFPTPIRPELWANVRIPCPLVANPARVRLLCSPFGLQTDVSLSRRMSHRCASLSSLKSRITDLEEPTEELKNLDGSDDVEPDFEETREEFEESQRPHLDSSDASSPSHSETEMSTEAEDSDSDSVEEVGNFTSWEAFGKKASRLESLWNFVDPTLTLAVGCSSLTRHRNLEDLRMDVESGYEAYHAKHRRRRLPKIDFANASFDELLPYFRARLLSFSHGVSGSDEFLFRFHLDLPKPSLQRFETQLLSGVGCSERRACQSGSCYHLFDTDAVSAEFSSSVTFAESESTSTKWSLRLALASSYGILLSGTVPEDVRDPPIEKIALWDRGPVRELYNQKVLPTVLAMVSVLEEEEGERKVETSKELLRVWCGSSVDSVVQPDEECRQAFLHCIRAEKDYEQFQRIWELIKVCDWSLVDLAETMVQVVGFRQLARLGTLDPVFSAGLSKLSDKIFSRCQERLRVGSCAYQDELARLEKLEKKLQIMKDAFLSDREDESDRGMALGTEKSREDK